MLLNLFGSSTFYANNDKSGMIPAGQARASHHPLWHVGWHWGASSCWMWERMQAVKSQLAAYLWGFPRSVSSSVAMWDVQMHEFVPANSKQPVKLHVLCILWDFLTWHCLWGPKLVAVPAQGKGSQWAEAGRNTPVPHLCCSAQAMGVL